MFKLAISQINPIPGNIKYNFEKIKNGILKAKDCGADLIIFPEFALSGYPFGNIFERHQALLNVQDKYINEIKNLSVGITIVFGYLNDVLSSDFKVFKDNAEIQHTFKVKDKTFTINYGLDDEADFSAEYYINCLNSPSRVGVSDVKDKVYSEFCASNNISMIYVNQVGLQDSFVFDGASRIYDNFGNLTFLAKSFEEDFAIIEDFKGNISKSYNSNKFNEFSIKNYENDIERCYEAICLAVSDYFQKNGFNKAVLGLSGGLDSTICAVILKEVLGPDNVLGVSMPSNITSNSSKSDAEILAKNLGINFKTIPISNIKTSFENALNPVFESSNYPRLKHPTTLENLQARTRATILWSISNEFDKMLPIATSDKSEFYIGYATINGDMTGGFAPIADVCKTKLFEMGRFLNKKLGNVIPESILTKRPGAELKLDKNGNPVCAEDDNMPYHFLDEIIFYVENYGFGFDELLSHKFEYEVQNNIDFEQKKEWLTKFYNKMHTAVFKWHLSPPTVIVDSNSINSIEYRHPIISCVK